MKWLRKKIIDWLFGTNFVDYKELCDIYLDTSNRYMSYLDKEKEFIDSMMKLIELNEQILHQNKVFIHTLEENGIDVDKIDFNKDV